MIDNTKVSEIMTPNVVTLSASDTIWDIESTFSRFHLRHAPVLDDDGELVGMISIMDLQRFTEDTDVRKEEFDDKGPDTLIAEDIMARNPVAVQADHSVKDAALIFTENEFHALPVLDRDRLTGIISTTDIIRFFLDNF